jgi:thymidylate synthase
MNNLDKQYQNLLNDILENGVEKGDRTGTGTISVFGRQIRHKMSDGFPLLTTKKMAWKSMVTELLWFLKGDTNIKYLIDNGCHIWDGDALKNFNKHIDEENAKMSSNYLYDYQPKARWSMEEFIERIKTDSEFAKKWGDLGPIYGAQWRHWNTNKTIVIGHNGTHNEWGTVIIDQIRNLIHDLKTNPDSRRLIVNAWNSAEIENMTLPPCHYGFQCYTRELNLEERRDIYFKLHPDWVMIGTHQFFDNHNIPKRAISLMWNQRSVDTFLGLPFNISSYGLLLEIIAKEVNMIPEELIGNLGDTHLYSNHIEQAKEQISRDTFYLPKIKIKDGISLFDGYQLNDFDLIDYESHPSIKAPLSN